MSINTIKDNINEHARIHSKLIVSFLEKKDLKNFSNKRKITNSIHSLLMNDMESRCSLIINKKTRQIKRGVYFADDISLPSDERSSLTTKKEHIVDNIEYLEIINYKSCYKNVDYINARKRKKVESKLRKKRREQQKLYEKLYDSCYPKLK
jgi:hypothetical protein